MEEALTRADEAGLKMASIKKLSNALSSLGTNKDFACWTGIMAGYNEPDKELGKEIDYTDHTTEIRYVFPVPEEHQGKKNAILVAKHPKFTLEADGMFRIVRAREVDLIPNFPTDPEKWYHRDERYGIPVGHELIYRMDSSRYLGRIDKQVGLAAIGNWQEVFLDYCPSRALAVAIEISTPKITGAGIRELTLEEFKSLTGDSGAVMPKHKIDAVLSLLQSLEG